MTTIIINAITHRSACTDSLNQEDLIVYDKSIDSFFEKLEKEAKEAGFGFEIDKNGQGTLSYRVTDEVDYVDIEAAHNFMHSPKADFWSYF